MPNALVDGSLPLRPWKGEQSNFIKVLLLSITSYSGFILAVSKFYKLDEKKENAHNLRDRFADLQTKIQYYVDYIKPWNDKAHYQHNFIHL